MSRWLFIFIALLLSLTHSALALVPSRRVTQEQLNSNATTTHTNSFMYDRGVAGGPGALTTDGPTNATFGLWWSAMLDAFSRVNTETNNAIGFLAYGVVNGQCTLSAWLDSLPIQILDVGTNMMQWRTFLELSLGTHLLQVNALHPSGFYTATTNSTFINNITNEVTYDTYDGKGNVTNRVWINASGATNRTQSLAWDAKGRLFRVIETNPKNYGFIWSAVYDALHRRISVTTMLISNGIPSVVPPQVQNSYCDPEVEALELGVTLNSAPQTEFLEAGTSPSVQTTWKLYGPDLNGVYGGENGTGGLDAVSPYQNTFNPVISDARGNVLAEVTNGVASWTLARPTGYGAVPGFRPVAFGNGVDDAQSSVWLGREVDVTGYYNIFRRPYDPVSDLWLTYDPFWNDRDPNGMSFCGGDPFNYGDWNGLMSAQFYNNNPTQGLGSDNGARNLYFGFAEGTRSYVQTTTYYEDGPPLVTGPGTPGNAGIADPSQVTGQSYEQVTEQTGLWSLFAQPVPLPDNYGQPSTVNITADFQAQQMDQFLAAAPFVLASVATDTEGFLPDALAAEETGVSLTEGISGSKGTSYFGGYDPETGQVYLGSDGHFGGMQGAGGTPLPGTTPGISVLETPTGVTWANDSLSLPKALTPEQAAQVQSALQAQFPGKVVTQVTVIK